MPDEDPLQKKRAAEFIRTQIELNRVRPSLGEKVLTQPEIMDKLVDAVKDDPIWSRGLVAHAYGALARHIMAEEFEKGRRRSVFEEAMFQGKKVDEIVTENNARHVQRRLNAAAVRSRINWLSKVERNAAGGVVQLGDMTRADLRAAAIRKAKTARVYDTWSQIYDGLADRMDDERTLREQMTNDQVTKAIEDMTLPAPVLEEDEDNEEKE